MRRLIPLVLLAMVVTTAAVAQQFTKQTPLVKPSENHYRAESYFNTADGGGRWQVELSVRDSGDVELRRFTISGPGAPCGAGATAVAFNDALVTAIGGETGGNVRRVRARIINFLNANSCFGEAGTVAP